MADIEAKGAPTKEFFVNVLGKDILLVDAIVDLVDNSVDGARRLRSPDATLTDTECFAGLWIKIEVKRKHFRIHDNCGGIPVKVASEYAFRFGRPPKTPKDALPDYATGQFGVGMKRAFFKMGSHFTVQSATKTSRFNMDVDVTKWLSQDEGDWHFEMTDVEENVKVPKPVIGTDIVVDRLHKTISADFSDDTVIGQLKERLHDRHMLSLHRGLSIELNGTPIRVTAPSILMTRSIKPAYRRFSLNSGEPVKAEIICGVRNATSRDAGWSVFLNDRTVLIRDTTRATGWGDKDEGRVPRYHPQYGRFRGYVFLTCPDTSRLPWDTTKTTLDEDQPEYRRIEREMIALMEPVIRFLDDVKQETAFRNATGKVGPLLQALDGDEQDLFDAIGKLSTAKGRSVTHAFKRPPRTVLETPEPTEQSIQFSRPKDQIAVLKKFFGVGSGKAAGESAWDFVFEVEDLG
jgi:hypothetical protein